MDTTNCPHCGQPIEEWTPEERKRQEILLSYAPRVTYRDWRRYCEQMGYDIDPRHVPPAANVQQGPI